MSEENKEVLAAEAAEVVVTPEKEEVKESGLSLEEKLKELELKYSELEKKSAFIQQEYSEYKVSAQKGLTDFEGFELAKWHYGKLKDKPETFEVWISNIVENKDAIPKGLKPYMAFGEEMASLPQAKAEKASIVKPKQPVAHSTAGSNIKEAVTSEKLKEVTEYGKKTGDWEPFKKLKAQMKS